MSAVVLSVTAFVVALIAFGRAYRDHGLVKKELIELEAELHAAHKLLKQRADLANEIAHEIKNPITAILCSADTLDLLVGPKLEDQHRLSLKYIREYGDNLLRLLTDFIDLSRAEAGDIRARPEGIQVVPVVESILGLLEASAAKKKIQLDIILADDSLYAYADPKHLKQIVFNLVHNAIKFTEPGGQIDLEVKSGFPDSTVVIAVRDNGVGIPENEIANLFNLYARYERSGGSAVETGVGLGLALCKELVGLAGGRIEVSSKVGVGSVFSIYIPQLMTRTLDVHESRLVEELVNNPLAGQRFLVFDSDEGSRAAVSSLIEAWGGIVDTVHEAVDAIEALKEKRYDAVMVDSSLCHDALDTIRDRRESNGTAVIVSCKSKQEEQLSIEAGADQAIAKPLNGKLLLTSLLNSSRDRYTH